jgi:3-oxoacyl-[acyl-carrier protein] reductase
LGGRVVLVTGGSRGIGAATVRLLVEAGARVVLSYERADKAAVEVVRGCGGSERCVALRAELASVEQGRELVRRAVEVWGRLDGLVVNHGIWPPEDVGVDTMTEERWARTVGVNLDSVFGLVGAAVEVLKGQQRGQGGVRGHVVLVSSTAGQRGEAWHVDYAATKGAVISLTKSLGPELARDGILCNCVAPGWVGTEMAAPALADEAGRARVFGAIPLGRVGTPEEIAGPIVFLLSKWAGFMTGEIVNVNGGAVLVG